MNLQRLLKTAVLSCILISGSAFAIPIVPAVGSIAVDFRTAPWSPANGVSPYSVGTVTATASTGTLYQDSIDGLGIQGGENDEIDLVELLTIDFGGGGSLLGRIYITDLFAPADGDVGEHGEVTLTLADLSTVTIAFGPGTQPLGSSNGEYLVDLGGNKMITKAVFKADNTVAGIDPTNNEYSVAGFDVPEPGIIALLGIGLLGFGVSSLRKR